MSNGGGFGIYTTQSSGGGGGSDEKVKISSADTTTNYLENKLVAGSNITLTKQNTGANETIQINATSGATGIIGIADGSGGYTYYASLSLAFASATSGDTIIFFDDYTETSGTSINLVNGVDVNLNGHSYTLSSADATNMFTSSVGAQVTFYNGKIIRTNAVPTNNITGLCFYLSRDTILTLESVEVIGSSDAVIITNLSGNTNVQVIGGIFRGGSSTYSRAISFTNEATLINLVCFLSQPFILDNSKLIDSVIQNSSTGASNDALQLATTSLVANCYVEHTESTNTSDTIQVASNSFLRNCTSINKGSGIAIDCSGAEIYDCYGESLSGNAIRLLSNSFGKNCSAVSRNNTSNAYYIDSSELQNSSGINDSDSRVVFLVRDAIIFNCSFTTNGVATSGQVIFIQATDCKISKCTLSVGNANKDGIDGNNGVTAQIVDVMGNMSSGQLINTTNVTNSQVNNQDGFGNILLG
jgi:hypothetical protein